MYWWADMWNELAGFFGYGEWVWGSAGEWFGGLFAGATVLWAIFLYRQENIRRRRAQAEQVRVRIQPTTTSTERRNSTDSIVSVVNGNDLSLPYVEVWWGKRRWNAERECAPTYATTNGDDMDPKEHLDMYCIIPEDWETTCAFYAEIRDANGEHWYWDVLNRRFVSRRRFNWFVNGVEIPMTGKRLKFRS
ncbi:hypothetical protein [Microbacterium oxydans]|uniref:hypothetical protein n=1 Tax=Microbacterium oxydans TaxID=82380 RepID=UPI0024AD8964|nr:hypothetical protein [Microbacterium oxydans]